MPRWFSIPLTSTPEAFPYDGRSSAPRSSGSPRPAGSVREPGQCLAGEVPDPDVALLIGNPEGDSLPSGEMRG